MKNKNGLAAIGIVLIVIVCLILGGLCGYYYLKNQEKDIVAVPIITSTITPSATSSSATTTVPTDKTADWKTYTNNVFGYSFKYPAEYKLVDECYNGNQKKEMINENNHAKWLVQLDKNMPNNYPPCESEFLPKDLIVGSYDQEVNINQMMETSDTDIESEVIINGIKWAKQIFTQPDEFSEAYTTHFYANHNGKGYTISTKNTDSAGNHDAEVDKIMETFKFTD